MPTDMVQSKSDSVRHKTQTHWPVVVIEMVGPSDFGAQQTRRASCCRSEGTGTEWL